MRRSFPTYIKATASAALIAFSADGAIAETFPQKLVGHGGPVRAIALSQDRKTAITAAFDYQIIVWDLTTHKATIRHRMTGHNAAVNDVAFVPGSDEIVSVSDDGSFGIWNAKTGALIAKIDDTADKVLDVAVSPKADRAAIARWDGTARLFDIKARKEVAKLTGHRGQVNAVAFSPDGDTLYTASYDGTIRAWKTATGEFIDPVYDHGWGINKIEVTRDGKTLIFGALDGTLGAIDLATSDLKQKIAKFERPILALALSPDGKTIASGNGGGYINLFHTETLKAKRDAAGSFGPVWGIAFTGNDDALYHVGLDDFAAWHALGKGQPLPRVQSQFPRRFQLSKAKSPGELEFQRKCSVCHTLTPDSANRAGPTLYAVFGRKAGELKDYDYSKALKTSGITWNAKTLAQLFDDGPDVMVPGTKMPVQRLKSIERLDDLIEFLRVATAPDKTDKKGDTQ